VVEILQDRPGAHDWQLLIPALASAMKEQCGPGVLVDPPFVPFGPSLQAQGVPASRLMTLQAGKPQARLWACEQAIRCCDVAAVLAWLPNARAADLRRLHLAAAQHDRLLFVFRGLNVQQEASPARLRLRIEEGGELKLRILKRRGPPVEAVISLATHPERLQQLLASRHRKEDVAPPSKDRSHVLDRTVSFA
jgi:protein ImuA